MLRENLTTKSEIEQRYYFQPIKRIFSEKESQFGIIDSLNYLTEVMRNSIGEVNAIIDDRISNGIIKDADQTRKSVAGNALQGLIAYSLIRLQEENLLCPDLIVTLKPRNHPLIENYAIINVYDEIQKPDLDLLVFHKFNPLNHPIMIYSIKTSLRERAGQAYKWKLLMDIVLAEDCQSIKNKYDLRCSAMRNFKVGFITTDFYNESTNPQQRGMLRFFDYAYVTKPMQRIGNIASYSAIVSDLNSAYNWHSG